MAILPLLGDVNTMKVKNIPFYENQFYHVFNRGNNGEKIFFKQENYHYFLKKFVEYLDASLDVYAFCLLPNHFHFLVKIKEHLSVKEHLPSFQNLAGVSDSSAKRNPVSQAFSNFFNAYSKAINKQENRSGSLFEKPMKRILIDDHRYLTHVVFYIHTNPEHHKISNNFKVYPWSSYKRILNNKPSKLKKKEVIEIFDGWENYIEYHETVPICMKDAEKYFYE